MGFRKFKLKDSVLEGIEAMQYTDPTPVQEQAIPIILKNKDVMGFAQTGTGKTAAFLIPLLEKFDGRNDNKIKCLILVPTRELAQQIEINLTGLGYFTTVTSQAVYGGNQSNEFSQQKNSLTNGVDVVIATPGRLMQHIGLGYVDFSNIEILILDEADRMLDMGFVDDIMKINKLLPEKKQTLLFSATMDPKLKKLAGRLLTDPQEISLAIAKPAEGINQMAYLVYNENKLALLESVLNNQKIKSMIIFASRKSEVDRITRKLKQMGFNAVSIHSDRTQDERNEAMRLFKSGKYDVLVATDIVSRGIDIDDLSHVLNFDIPGDAADYVHRIGRTARAGKEGAAISFINPDDMGKFAAIERLIERPVEKHPTPPEIGESPEYSPRGSGSGKKSFRGKRKGNRHGNRSGGQSKGRHHRGRNKQNRGKRQR